jgi:hypothetical protein
MNIIDAVIKKNTLKPPQNDIIQEFVVRIKLTTNETDPKVIREALDNIESVLRTANYRFSLINQHIGEVEVTQVYAK